jgi:hypothetical protein
MSVIILAIELGKFNSVLCHYDPETREASFRTVKTTPTVLRVELPRQFGWTRSHPPPLVASAWRALAERGLFGIPSDLGIRVADPDHPRPFRDFVVRSSHESGSADSEFRRTNTTAASTPAYRAVATAESSSAATWTPPRSAEPNSLRSK